MFLFLSDLARSTVEGIFTLSPDDFWISIVFRKEVEFIVV